MNVLYSCCISDVWLKVASKLEDDLNLKCKYFIGWKDDINLEKLKSYGIDGHCHFVEDAWRGKGFPEYTKKISLALDEEIYSALSVEMFSALKMIDRLDPTGEKFSFSERNYWIVQLIEKWLTVIDEERIEIIISPSIPHRVFDYALYIAAKIKKVKFLMFQMTPFSDKSFIIDNVDETPAYLKGKCKEEGEIPKDIVDRIEVLFKNYNEARPDYMVRQQNESRIFSIVFDKVIKIKKISRLFEKANTYRVIRKNDPFFDGISLFKYNLKSFSGVLYKRHLKKMLYKSIDASKSRRGCNDDFVLVALHYQPEETSCPTGGFYAEQRQIVRLLESTLPESVKIYVKEHTSQFHPKMEGEAGRGGYFYQDLLSISDRVILIDDREDTFNLIDSAIATVTISGTIGWESVFRGTPSLIFGRAWYEDMPGVYKVKSSLDLIDSFNLIRSTPMPDKNCLISYHKQLNKYLIPSAHYKATADKKITSTDDSVKNLSFAIKRYLNEDK